MRWSSLSHSSTMWLLAAHGCSVPHMLYKQVKTITARTICGEHTDIIFIKIDQHLEKLQKQRGPDFMELYSYGSVRNCVECLYVQAFKSCISASTRTASTSCELVVSLPGHVEPLQVPGVPVAWPSLAGRVAGCWRQLSALMTDRYSTWPASLIVILCIHFITSVQSTNVDF